MSEIPPAIEALQDDPIRRLASALQRACDSAKKSTRFREVAGADSLRCCVSSEVLAKAFEGALGQPIIPARSPAARDLQGWTSEAQERFGACAFSASPNAGR